MARPATGPPPGAVMKVFAIMPFDRQYDAIYDDIIFLACTQLGLEPDRADRSTTPGPIPDQVLESIANALFLVADVSEQNDNVFYELGYAAALKKKIIVICNRNRRQELPFDIQVDRTIFYDRQEPNWQFGLIRELSRAIRGLYEFSKIIKVYYTASGREMQSGDELEGHYHRLTGQLLPLTSYNYLWFFTHLWFFVQQDGLGRWSPMNDGEVQVIRDGRWDANLYLGWAGRHDDVDRKYHVAFGLIDTVESRRLTEFCINCQRTNDFPGEPQLPGGFVELARFTVKRVLR